MQNDAIKITECPRDAQQGLPFVISAEDRAAYINQLMLAGFDIIDFGSFVSPKAVPQMADSDKVLELIDKSISSTRLLAIVGNERGAMEAAAQEKVDIIGFPYSISNTFLEKNIHSSIQKADATVAAIGKICADHKKKFRVYISMAFGNPYHDPWNEALALQSIIKLAENGAHEITLSDTVGLATTASISNLFEAIPGLFSGLDTGLHLHTEPKSWYDKIDAAWKAGCRSFDSVINGIGGCPLTGFELVGNLNTLHLLSYFKEKNISHRLNEILINELALTYDHFKNLQHE